MKKLYEKSEISFAILWIVIYTVGIGTLNSSFGFNSPWPMLGLIVICAAMLLFVIKNGLTEKYGLSGWTRNGKAMLWLIPLWLISSINLFGGFTVKYPVAELIYAAVSMALVGYAEEQIFRGFLFKAMMKDGSVRTAVIVASVTFALGHVVNLFSGQNLVDTLNQMFFAIAVGFVITMVFYKGGSLLPCILAHSFIDVSSVFAPEDGPESLNVIVHVGVFVISVAYCIYLVKRVETPAVNRVEARKPLITAASECRRKEKMKRPDPCCGIRPFWHPRDDSNVRPHA